jgi:hypothetical protein
MQKLGDWFRSNKLCLNVKQTKYILFIPTTKYQKCIREQFIGQEVERMGNNQNEEYIMKR